MFKINRGFSFCLIKKSFIILISIQHFIIVKTPSIFLCEEYFNKLLITSTLRYTLE